MSSSSCQVILDNRMLPTLREPFGQGPSMLSACKAKYIEERLTEFGAEELQYRPPTSDVTCSGWVRVLQNIFRKNSLRNVIGEQRLHVFLLPAVPLLLPFQHTAYWSKPRKIEPISHSAVMLLSARPKDGNWKCKAQGKFAYSQIVIRSTGAERGERQIEI